MAHKTFISYKYSEAKVLRDRIIRALGVDATYYQGETSVSPDLTDTTTENIKKKLSDMMYATSVLIVILSPNMKDSNWINWEIGYCLQSISRKERISHINGVVGVIMKKDGTYDWLVNHGTNCHGNPIIYYNTDELYPILNKNHFNSNPPQWHCNECKSYDWLSGSYIEYVKEDDFLNKPSRYIDNAYEKSENDAEGYDITKRE